MSSEPKSQCKCTYPCPRHGNCQACQDYHRKDGSLTNCGKGGESPEPPEKPAGTR